MAVPVGGVQLSNRKTTAVVQHTRWHCRITVQMGVRGVVLVVSWTVAQLAQSVRTTCVALTDIKVLICGRMLAKVGGQVA